MGIPQIPHEVQLFTGLLYRENELGKIESLLESKWGKIMARSESFPFHYSKYYEDELGLSPMRIFFAFDVRFRPDHVGHYKIESNQIEQNHARNGLRTFNIDPGYVDLDKIVLATTKPATYRIYLGEGIYAQSTLYFKDGSFHVWPWTYRDYAEERALDFFVRVRNQFKESLTAVN